MTEKNIYNSYKCAICGFTYNEATGLPEEDIPPGTSWKDIPNTWVCPDCGVSKSEFEVVSSE